MRALGDVCLRGRSVLLRADLNVPLRNGTIASDARIRAVVPTVKQLLSSGAQVVLLSHLGRPVEGSYDESCSLLPVAKRLSDLLAIEVPLVRDWSAGTPLSDALVQLLENVRFCVGETACDASLSRRIADMADVFVMDAFATAHRAHASTVGAIRYARESVAGPLLLAEMEAIDAAMSGAKGKRVAVVGGAKVSGKLELLESLANNSDRLLLGGGILNTFLHAHGFGVGASLCEPGLADVAREIGGKGQLLLPTDLVVRSPDGQARCTQCDDVHSPEQIGDIGAESIAFYCAELASADFVIWNGPMGIFEDDDFSQGTCSIAQAIAACPGFTLAGGGDTISAIERFVRDKNDISHISTAGGAFLEYLSYRKLPVIDALRAETG